MSKYLISFEKGSMDHFTEADWPVVGQDSHAVVQAAKDAGAYVFGGGLDYDSGDVEHAVVGVGGLVTDGPYPEGKELVGGFMILDLKTRDDALKWAAKTAKACRCAQDVRKFGDDPDA